MTRPLAEADPTSLTALVLQSGCPKHRPPSVVRSDHRCQRCVRQSGDPPARSTFTVCAARHCAR